MDWKKEWKPLVLMVGIFLLLYYLPIGNQRFDNAIHEALQLVKWYAHQHVILCLIPAFFIAGAIGVFVSQTSVMKYLGTKANKFLSYSVASVSGTLLAVCSCTVLPLFAGIYWMGAGIGPASVFLYSGPAINVLAIILTARVLGIELGIARAVGAIVFSVVIGLLMHFIFRKEEEAIINAFADGIKRGVLEWKIINIEDAGNEHFEDDYQLYTQSLVIVEIRNGKQQRWKNLEKIWELISMKEAYLHYVREEVKSYLQGNA